MKNGGWIPIDKNLYKELPTDRKFSTVEAMFCLQYDLDVYGKYKPIRHYAQIWMWSKSDVGRLLSKVGVGWDKVWDKSGTNLGQRYRIIKGLEEKTWDKSGTNLGQGLGQPFIYINPNNPNLEENAFLSEIQIAKILTNLEKANPNVFKIDGKRAMGLVVNFNKKLHNKTLSDAQTILKANYGVILTNEFEFNSNEPEKKAFKTEKEMTDYLLSLDR